MANKGNSHVNHVGAEELAAYLDNQLSPAERARTELHLAGCEECREEAARVAELVRSRTTLPKRRAVFLVPGVAAAAVIVLLLTRPSDDAEAPVESLRSGDEVTAGEGTPVIDVLSPRGEVVQPDTLLFAWRPASVDAAYDLIMTDWLGSVIWHHQTRDTMVALPDTVRLQRNRTYFWRVDALIEEGRSASTQSQRFQTAP